MVKRGLGRRGTEDTQKFLLVLFQAIFALAIAVSLFSFVKGVETNQAFEKKYLSRDISLLAGSIYSLPGDVRLRYSQEKIDLKKFSFEFANDKVTIRGLDHETGLSPVSYPYLIDSNLLSKVTKVESADEIPFQKEGDRVFLGEIKDMQAVDCPHVPKPKMEKPVIDPGHGGADTGYTGPTIVEEEVTSEIAESLKPWIPKAVLTRSVKKGNRDIDLDERVKKAGEGDFVISIHAGWDSDPVINRVVVYYPAGDRESMGVACRVAWGIYSGSPVFTGYSYLPLPANMIKQADPYSVIAKGKGIVVEAGNINDPLLPFHLSAVAKGIGEGLR